MRDPDRVQSRRPVRPLAALDRTIAFAVGLASVLWGSAVIQRRFSLDMLGLGAGWPIGLFLLTTLTFAAAATLARSNARATVMRDGMRRIIRRARDKSRELGVTLENMGEGIMMVDGTGRIRVMNRRLATMLDLDPDFPWQRHTYASLIAWQRDQGEFRSLAGKEAETFRAHVSDPDGRPLKSKYLRQRPDGTVLEVRTTSLVGGGFVRTFTDVTMQRRAESQLQYIAHHDVLTGLFNRHGLIDRLDRRLNSLESGETFALHVLDLDRFNVVNDAYGHVFGDRVLKEVAVRLRSVMSDNDTVARLGGDEFALVQATVPSVAAASALAARIAETVGQPFEIDGKRIEISCRVGTALAPDHGSTRDEIMRATDLALLAAKSSGSASTRHYEVGMSEAVIRRRALEADLLRAVANGELEVHYQPILKLAERRVSGFEALVRWRHPSRGLVSPGEFIPVAEEIGLIPEIGRIVMRMATAAAATWPVHLKLAVNLSPVELGTDEVVRDIRRALEKSGIEASRLELEITETALLRSDDRTRARLDALEEMGIGMSMDDFGTGYSSLGYLRRFAFDKIKIDRSFVAEIGRSADCRAIIETITVLAHRLRMITTAEGIETQEQLAELVRLGCTEGQGYLFAKPMPASEVAAYLARADSEVANAA